MNVFWNNRIMRLSPYIAGEQPRNANIVKLNANENPYPPSPKVIEAIKKAAAGDRLRLYPDSACTVLREAAAERYKVLPEQVFAGNGSDEALAFAFGAFFQTEPADEPVLFPDITYSFYPVYANLWGVPFKEIPLRDDFSINVSDYYEAVNGVIFPNPNAPTGIALSARDVLCVSKHCAEKNKTLIVDEAYQAFGAESVVPFINENPGLLTVHTLSKSASLAGLRAGFAIGQRHLIEALERIRDSFNSYTVDAIAQAAAAAALLDISYYDEINRRVIETRERTAVELAALGFKNLPSSANFIFTTPPSPLNAPRLFTLLRENGILVRYFDKPRTKDFLRVSIGLGSDMDRFLEVCAAAVKNAGCA
ncbi:MAG: aminotransferase class I/II-fold pyridoxal phosphate-dependent enzyme [Spirochaetaceae bacterium]|nr:aminotransferase class I/II-fold pyridoxal phosphate-dependent enzyme [Spirochaetaceae bacterium]